MSPLFSTLWLDSGWTSLIAATFGSGKGMKISLAILVPKAGTSSPCSGLDLIAGVVLGLEFGLVERFDNGMGSIYSSSMSSSSKVENIAS